MQMLWKQQLLLRTKMQLKTRNVISFIKQEAMGNLLYVSVKTRPYTNYVFNCMSRYTKKPTNQDQRINA